MKFQITLAIFYAVASGTAPAATLMILPDLTNGKSIQLIRLTDDGQTIVGVADDEVFSWHLNSGRVVVGNLSLTGATLIPTAISGNGRVIAGRTEAGDAFRWTLTSGLQILGKLTGYDDHAWPRGLSYDGAVMVGSAKKSWPWTEPSSQGFRWTPNTGFVTLGSLGSEDSIAFAVSANGKHIVGRSGSRPFRWSADQGMEPLDPELDGYAATGVTDDGQTIIGQGDSTPYVSHLGTFRWTANGDLLRFGGGTLGSQATGISHDGRIMLSTRWDIDYQGSPLFPSIGKSNLWSEDDPLNSQWIQDLFSPEQFYEALGYYNPVIVATDLSASGRFILGSATSDGDWTSHHTNWLISLAVPETSSGSMAVLAIVLQIAHMRIRCA